MSISSDAAMASCHRLGFDIGGTKCAVVLGAGGSDAGAQPDLLGREEFATQTVLSPGAVLDKMLVLANRLLAENGLNLFDVSQAGVSCGGPLDSARGVVLSPPNLPGWDEVPVSRILSQGLGVPVHLQNDANACALAEWHWGAARGADTAVFLTYGTGLGAGLIINGRLYEGRQGMAGELGHWRLEPDGPVGYGKAGSFEGFCSGGGMARWAQMQVRKARDRGDRLSLEWTDASSVDVKKMHEWARRGDALAREVFETAGEMLGRGLALLVDLLNPEVIVIGSVFARCEDLIRPSMERALKAEALPASLAGCRVVPAQLGERIGDFAALAAGIKKNESEVGNISKV